MKLINCPSPSPFRHLGTIALTLTASLIWMTRPAMAAEEIRATFGLIQSSIPFTSLETYANDGILDDELTPYTRHISPEQLEELRGFLTTPVSPEVDLVAMSYFLNSDPGEVLLKKIGNVVRTRRHNGHLALRAALVLAAADQENGLTPLNIIDKFPTESLVIDFETGWAIVREVQDAINQSADAIAWIKDQFQAELAVNPSELEPLSPYQPATFPYSWQLASSSIILKRRAFPFDLYLPERNSPAPIIVISHGLGSNRDSYQYLAQYLAGHGFAVIVPEHKGSNAEHIQALLRGQADQVTESAEFINRTQDIGLILDELTQQAQTSSELIGRLDFETIGVVGQSFGGYTALALAGATLDFDYLESSCPSPEQIETGNDRNLNLSLLLQCRALDLAAMQTESLQLSLKDERIDAVIAINPIGSAIFGPDGMDDIEIPVMIMTGSADIVAPILWEQVYPFSWLQTPEKFLVTMHRGTHFSTIEMTEDDIPLPEPILGPVPETAQRYVKATSLAFFQTFLTSAPDDGGVPLTPGYINQISRDSMPLSIIQYFDLTSID